MAVCADVELEPFVDSPEASASPGLRDRRSRVLLAAVGIALCGGAFLAASRLDAKESETAPAGSSARYVLDSTSSKCSEGQNICPTGAVIPGTTADGTAKMCGTWCDQAGYTCEMVVKDYAEYCKCCGGPGPGPSPPGPPAPPPPTPPAPQPGPAPKGWILQDDSTSPNTAMTGEADDSYNKQKVANAVCTDPQCTSSGCSAAWGDMCCYNWKTPRGSPPMHQGPDTPICKYSKVKSATIKGFKGEDVTVTNLAYGHIYIGGDKNCGHCYAVYNPKNDKYAIVAGVDGAANEAEMGNANAEELGNGHIKPFYWKPIDCPQ